VGKKFTLPLFPSEEAASVVENAPRKPTIDAARKRLGGLPERGSTPPLAVSAVAPGVVVAFAAGATRQLGVVIYADAAEVHVLLDAVRLRRFSPGAVTAYTGDVAVEPAKIATDARLFGRLTDGQSVRYADDSGNLVDGKVVERCRWGALVLRDDGAIIAVGFRKLWPSTSHGAA
jgi:hypothetical protein